MQDPAPAFVSDCRPCRLQIGPERRPFAVTFDIDSGSEGRAVASIQVRQDGDTATQRLEVHQMEREAQAGKFFFGATDLNNDGNLDLLIATSRGVANTYVDYWRFVPQSNRFVYLGNFPILMADSSSGRLKSYERGGEGGRVYQAREWGFEGDSLVVLKENVQDPGKAAGEFVRIVRERKPGSSTLVDVSRERVREPQ